MKEKKYCQSKRIRTVVALSLRALRRVFRLIEDAWSWARTKYTLLLNNVEYGSIISHGVPYICVAPSGKCVIGDNVTMNNGLRFNPIGYVQPCTIYVNAGATLVIGNHVGLSQASVICIHSIRIGDYVKLGGGVKIYDTDFHSLNPDIRKNRELDLTERKCAPVVLEDNCFIGAGTTILKGVRVGENAVVGACSLVTRDIPANGVWAGVPAKFVRRI